MFLKCRIICVILALSNVVYGLPLSPADPNAIAINDVIDEQISVQKNFGSENAFPLAPSDPVHNPADIHLKYVSSSGSNNNVLSDYAHKWSTVARIANGISLMKSLINEQVPVFDVIGELLHFGDVKVGDLIGLKKEELDTLTSQLETLKLDDSVEAKNMTDFVVGMSRVREIFMNIADNEFNISSEHFAEADRFQNDTTGFTRLTEMVKTAQKAREKLGKLASYPDLTNDFVYVCLDAVKILEELEKIENPSSSFPVILQHLDTYVHLKNGDSINSLEQFINLLSIYESLSTNDASKIEGNIDSVSALSSTFNEIKSDLSLIRNVVNNRVQGSPNKLRYTAVFSNGASNLNLLIQDVFGSSIKKTLGNEKHYSRLSVGLQPLNTISSKLNAVELKLMPILKADVLKSTNKALRLQQLLSGLSVTSSDAVAVANLFNQNRFIEIHKSLTAAAIVIVNNSKKLSSEFARLKSSFETFPQAPPEVAKVKLILGTINKTSELIDVQTFMTEFNNKKDEVEKVLDYLESFLNLPNIVDLRAKAGEIFNAQQGLNNFLSKVISNYIPNLEKLKGATDPVDAVANALRASKIIMNLEKSDVSNLKLIFNAMTDRSVKILRTVPDDVKKEQTKDVQDLLLMKDSQKTSDAIGAVARLFYTMDKLQSMNSTVEALKQAGNTVFKKEYGNLTDPVKKNEIRAKWGDHSQFLRSLTTTYNQIETFKSSLTVVTDLRQLGGPLESAKSIDDVSGSASEKSEALAMLISESTDPNNKRILEDMKDNLDKLAALDLQFSSGKSAIPQAASSLTNLFDFLNEFLMDPSRTPGGNGTQPGAISASRESSGKLDQESGSVEGFGWGAIIFAVILSSILGGLVAGSGVWIYKRKIAENHEKKGKGNKDKEKNKKKKTSKGKEPKKNSRESDEKSPVEKNEDDKEKENNSNSKKDESEKVATDMN